MTSYDLAALRAREFEWATRGESIYLNCASTGPLPRRTVDAVQHALHLRALPSRFQDSLLWETLANSRRLAAQLLGVGAGEIALGTNTSYGINLAAAALPLQAGDVVIAPGGEFPANVYPWMAAAARRGAEYRQLPPTADGTVDEDALCEAVADPRVRVLAISWVGFADGYRCDLERLGRACRETGTYFVVDAIQGLGAAPLDVRACHVDILACGAQKWLLSPWGTAFTYVRSELAGQLEPHTVGWTAVAGGDDFSRLLDYDLTWRDDARRFESLTLPVHDFFGFNASAALLLELGIPAVAAHVESLVDRVVAWADGRTGFTLATPTDRARRAGIVSLRCADAPAASARLAAARVAHSMREGLLRLSPHCFTTSDEIDVALEALEPLEPLVGG